MYVLLIIARLVSTNPVDLPSAVNEVLKLEEITCSSIVTTEPVQCRQLFSLLHEAQRQCNQVCVNQPQGNDYLVLDTLFTLVSRLIHPVLRSREGTHI
jgi:hypothetical protein